MGKVPHYSEDIHYRQVLERLNLAVFLVITTVAGRRDLSKVEIACMKDVIEKGNIS